MDEYMLDKLMQFVVLSAGWLMTITGSAVAIFGA